ncbi:unnamed protein product [Acanthosepion pharaonis]|uniref:Uncharacterized protein n=1 Tax=Acanthosepion pharaonis TaxID=158019 RepID=A0A812AXJ7_ACAPH|nr:unnamed protein product [Sepia pharaonis]CAE1158581.1 unnamed protein product [Sepia pharaonis]
MFSNFRNLLEMATRIGLFLVIILISFVKNAQSQAALYNLKTYGCKGLYKFGPKVTEVIFRNSLNGTVYSSRSSTAVVTIPANSSVPLAITVINSTYSFRGNALQNSSEICCSDNVINSTNCYTFNLTCPNKCLVSNWPNYTGFYKTSKCNNCLCQYCYIGRKSGWQQLILPLNNHSHLLEIPLVPVDKNTTEIILPFNKIQITYRLPLLSNTVNLLPLPQDDPLQRYFTIVPVKGTFDIKRKLNLTLPPNGEIRLYFQPKSLNENTISVMEYKIMWYSQIICNLHSLYVSFLSDPILELKCLQGIRKPIIYNVSSSGLQMMGNRMYIKDLTVRGKISFTLSAVYAGIPDSAYRRTITANMTASASLLTVYGCKAYFNFKVLNYTELSLYILKSRTHSVFSNGTNSHIINLRPNETTTFVLDLKDQNLTFIATATSSEICCNETVATMNTSLCFIIGLTCPGSCEVSQWPTNENFHKLSKCENCVCRYCYTGFKVGMEQLLIPLNSSTHMVSVKIPDFNITVNKIIRPRNGFFTTIPIGPFVSAFSVLPNASYDRYFHLNYVKNSYSLQLKDNISFPSSGYLKIHLYPAQINSVIIRNIVWFTPVLCNVSHLQVRYMNDPFVEMDCENPEQLPIVFNLSSPILQIKNNSVYLQDLTAKRYTSFSLTAMYASQPYSLTTIKNIPVPTVLTNLSLLTVYGCKAVFNLSVLNYNELILYNSKIGMLKYADKISRTINLRPNGTYRIGLYISDQSMPYLATATSSGVCCNDTKVKLENCFTFTLTCPNNCTVSNWPIYRNFYKASDCNSCICQYCYVGNVSTFYQFMLPMKWSIHLIQFYAERIEQTSIKVIRPRREFLKLFQLPNSTFLNLSPFPRHGLLERYFLIQSSGYHFLQPKSNLTLPPNGHIQIYFQPISYKSKYVKIISYDVTWFSPINCNVTKVDAKYRNDPLLHLNCKNTLQKTIMYNISNSIFQVRGNSIYLKDLRVSGSFYFSITAMYEGMSESATTINVSLTLEDQAFEYPFLFFYGCELVFQFRYLNYSKLIFSSQQLGLNISITPNSPEKFYLPPNETIEFVLQVNDDTVYTLTEVSPDVCCDFSSKTYLQNLCYKLNLTCPDACAVSAWPNSKYFYKFSKCSGCECSYCFTGSPRYEEMYIPMKSSPYRLTIFQNKITKNTIVKTIRRWALRSNFTFPLFTRFSSPLPIPLGSIFEKHLTLSYNNSAATISSKQGIKIPENGQFKLYFTHNTFVNNTSLDEYEITWYDPLKCRPIFPRRVYLNDPLFYLNCFNAIRRPIIYNISDSNFWMKKNVVYVKNLTTSGYFNLYITAMFSGLYDSAATFNVSFILKENSSIIQDYGCKTLINMTFLKPGQEYDIISNQSIHGSFVPYIEFPPNKTNMWYIYWKEQNMKLAFKTKSPEICCNETTRVTQGICYTIQFPCEGPCALVTWPVFPDVYKTVNCGQCSCQYCYNASWAWQHVWEFQLKSSKYLLTFYTGPMKKIVRKLKIPWNRVRTRFKLAASLEILPLPWNSHFTVYKNLESEVIIQPMANKTLPRDGHQQIYLQTQETKSLIQYDIMWYSSVSCIPDFYKRKNPNFPLVMMNCVNPLKIPIVFHLKNNKTFQMIDNYVYLRELTANGTFNISITAMYKDMVESVTTINFPLTLNGLSFLQVFGCQAVVRKSPNIPFSDYQFLNVSIPELGYYKYLSSSQAIHLINLPRNKTIVFYLNLDNQNLTFTFIAKTPKYCCSENITYHEAYSCYTLRLKCDDSCSGIYPETHNFFVIPGPTKCSSVYCYRGGAAKNFAMNVPLKTTKLFYIVKMPATSRRNETVQFLLEWQKTPLMLPSIKNSKIWSKKYNPYFNISSDGYLFLLPNQPSPPEGSFNFTVSLGNFTFVQMPLVWGNFTFGQMSPVWGNFTFGQISLNLVDYHVYAFKHVRCSVVKLGDNGKMFPLAVRKFNCINALNVKLNTTVDNSRFYMMDTTLYMKLPPLINTTVIVSVMYNTLNESVSTYPVKFTLKQYFISMSYYGNMYDKVSLFVLHNMTNVEKLSYRPGKIMEALIKTTHIKSVKTTLENKITGFKILEYFTPVGQLFITKLTAVQDNKNRYTFTCHTNSTLKDLTYEWYWNDEQVLRGLSSSMQNGNSIGTIVFSELNVKDSGNVTCHVKGKNFIPYTLTKSVKMKDFPLVELNASSRIIQTDKPVTVACNLFQAYNSSKLVFKVNNQQQEKRKVTLFKESTVSCYGVSAVGQGEVKTLQIFMAVGKKLCPAGTYGGIDWPKTVAGSTANATCIKEYSGTVSRLCSKNGIWGVPNNSSCVKKSILDAKSTLGRISIGIGGNFDEAVENLANATKGPIEAEDISETINALDIASIITNKSKEVSKKEVKNFVNVVNNLVKDDTKTAWTKLEEKNQLTASSILKKVEDFGNIASQKINETVTVSTKNLVIEIEKVAVTKNIQFPTPNKTRPKWVEESKSEVFVPSSILKDKFNVNDSVSMNAVIFRNMKDLLPKSNETNNIVNSYILAISLGKTLENLSENISLTFSHLSQLYQESSCNFWDFSKNPNLGGSWSGRGCTVASSNSTYTICSCDHLTNFAILMNPVSHSSNKVLGIITKVGCSISIVALILTIIIYAISWKYVTSQDVTKSQSVLLMNLCVSLIIAYLIFLTLVEGPREKNACIAIAALLQYFFLVVFFTMLAEGIDMAIALTVVFAAKFSRLPWLLLSSWLGPAIIVGISLISTQTKGFGNDVFCWLTPEDNVIWAFIVPALIIIVINIICVALIVKSLLSAYCMLRQSIKQRLRTGARAIGILTPLLGFTWIFGVLAVNENLKVFEYLFTVASSLQGLFIFITYCVFNNQIQRGFWKRRKPTSQATLKPSTQSTSGTKLSELSNSKNKSYFSDDSLRESSEIQSDTTTYDEYRYSNTPLRYSDNGLRRPITPYYLNSSLKTTLNSVTVKL